MEMAETPLDTPLQLTWSDDMLLKFTQIGHFYDSEVQLKNCL